MTTSNSTSSMSPRARLPVPPVAPGRAPVIGHAGKLVRNPLDFLAGLRDHGELLRLDLGPTATAYAVTTPELVGQLLKSPDFEVGGPLWETLEALLGKGVATSNGPRHRRQRRTVQPAFGLDRLPRYVPVMEAEARALADRWKDGDIIDVTAESFRVAVRITARCLIQGKSVDERVERLSNALAIVFKGMYRRMVLSGGSLYRLSLPTNRRFAQALNDLHQLVDEIVAERRATRDRPDDLLTELLEAKGEHGTPVSEQEIHDQVVAILIPGSETVASTLMWIFQELAERPDVGEAVNDEITAVLANRPVQLEDLRRLTYVNNVITEIVRLRPAVWVLTRLAGTETELGGYRVPARTPILYSPYAMQRDPRSYSEHLRFDPDRWHPENSRSVPQYAMIPFGTGNRKCPGDHFSMALLAVVMARTIPRWRFQRAPASDDTVRIGITLRPKRLLVRVTPR